MSGSNPEFAACGLVNDANNKHINKDDTLPSSSNKCVPPSATVYTVWGLNKQFTGVPDILQIKHSLTYNMNGEVHIMAQLLIRVVNNLLSGAHALTDFVCKHNTIQNSMAQPSAVCRLVNDANNKHINKDDTLPTLLTSQTLLPPSATVYTVWKCDVGRKVIAGGE